MNSIKETNIYSEQGSTFTEDHVAIDPNTGLPLNLTGYTLTGQVRKWFGEAAQTFFICSVTNATTGNYNIALYLEDTVKLSPGRNVYDIVATSGSGVRKVIKSGQMIVKPGLTFIDSPNISGDVNYETLTIIQGSDFSHIFEIRNADGSFLDLTGYTAQMQIRPTADSPVVIADYNTTNGSLVTTPLFGQITLSLAGAITSALSFDYAVFDLEITKTSTSAVTRVTGGAVELIFNITRP